MRNMSARAHLNDKDAQMACYGFGNESCYDHIALVLGFATLSFLANYLGGVTIPLGSDKQLIWGKRSNF